ncbi:TIGR00266 family protein [Thalassoglobus sp.]|uniref:TIGR00266 family protein n=1 Tax=Thalassoglobus sp. TaxID=2795869 RepID=UPI003AA96BDB
MNIEMRERGAFCSALVHLEPGEEFVSEAGAMFRASENIDINVTTKSRGKGGIMGGLKRLMASENFFFSTYKCNNNEPGEVGLAPTLQGDVLAVECDGQNNWLCTGGSYLGSSSGLEVNTKFQGLKGFLSGESISFVEISGQGELLVNAFGRIAVYDIDGELTVDTGHVVAFEDSLTYEPRKAASSWIQSYLSGEGIVLNFSGKGQILVQSHNPKEFGGVLGSMLPPRK